MWRRHGILRHLRPPRRLANVSILGTKVATHWPMVLLRVHVHKETTALGLLWYRGTQWFLRTSNALCTYPHLGLQAYRTLSCRQVVPSSLHAARGPSEISPAWAWALANRPIPTPGFVYGGATEFMSPRKLRDLLQLETRVAAPRCHLQRKEPAFRLWIPALEGKWGSTVHQFQARPYRSPLCVA